VSEKLRQVDSEYIHIETDTRTGEVTRAIHQKRVKYKQEEPFLKLYLKHIMIYNELPTKHADILLALGEHMTYADDSPPQTVYLNGALKEKIADTCGISVRTLNNSLTELVKAKMLFRPLRDGVPIRGTFTINPFIIGKGEWKDVVKLRIAIEFDADGKKLDIEYKKKVGLAKSEQIDGQEMLALEG